MIHPDAITVPSEHGRIVDRHAAADPQAPLIAVMQDVFYNYEATLAEAAVMAALMRDYRLDLVLIEGQDSGIDLEADLKRYRGERTCVRAYAAEKLIKEHGGNALDYLDLMSDLEFVRQGMEDMALHRIQTQLQHELLRRSDRASRVVAVLQSATANLSQHVLQTCEREDRAAGSAETSSREARAATIEAWVPMLLRFVQVRLVPHQWDFLRTKQKQLDLAGWCDILSPRSAKDGLIDLTPADLQFLVRTLEMCERFYGVADRRRHAFVQNIAANLIKYNRDKAIVFAGGFHAPYLAQMFREKGYSLVVIAPKFELVRESKALERKTIISNLRYLNGEGLRSTMSGQTDNT